MNLAKQYERVQAMSESELEAYAKAHRVDLTHEFNELGDARNYVCEQLALHPNKKGT